MADYRSEKLDANERYGNIIRKQSGVAAQPYHADGYVNLITKFGTQRDVTEQYKYEPEPEYPDEVMTMHYESDGLFAKIIDAPAEEAVKHGFTLDGLSDSKLIDFYEQALDELDWEETAMTALKWSRLFGGSIAVLLINDGRGLEEPLDWRSIKSIDDVRVYERSLIQPDYSSMFHYDPQNPFRTRGSRLGMPETYRVSSRYGTFTVHESRCLTFQNGLLPENTRTQTYQLWGVPEYVRIHRSLRDAEIAHANAPKLLERSVQAIYKMKNLSAELATEQGEELLLKRLQAIDMARGFMNSMVIDADGEDYDFKSFAFNGVNDVVSAACNMLSAVSNIPQVILFGQPIGGMSSTDDTTMEMYYNYVERLQKRQLRSNLRYLLSIIFRAGVATGEIDEVPNINVKFNPLWSLSDVEQADLDQKKAQLQQTKAQTAQIYVDMQAIDPTEVRKKLADSEEFDVENMLDEIDDEEDIFADTPDGLSYLSEQDRQKAMKEYGSSSDDDYATEADVEPHNTDPGTFGSASTAAPAATKLPQDMSAEELQQSAQSPETEDKGDKLHTTHPDGKTGGVGVICVQNGAVLVATRRDNGLLCGPGGHIEEGETAEQAAIRETEEEFGVTPTELILIGRGPEEPETGITPDIFLCTAWEGEPHPVDDEMADITWLTPDLLAQYRPSMFAPFADGYDLMIQVLEQRAEQPADDSKETEPEPSDEPWYPHAYQDKPEVGAIPITTKDMIVTEDERAGLDLLREFILDHRKKLVGGEKTLDFSVEKDTISSKDQTEADGFGG